MEGAFWFLGFAIFLIGGFYFLNTYWYSPIHAGGKPAGMNR